MPDISVVIPVGPHPSNQQWLDQAIESASKADQILLIDDTGKRDLVDKYWGKVDLWVSPWRLGVAHAFNFGVAIARHNHVIMLGSDDTLAEGCIDICRAEAREGLFYQYFPLRYMDTGEVQDIACNAAMVTKELWQHTGGFPVQSASGAPDCALLSILMAHKEAGLVVKVGDGTPLYNYRRHPETNTAKYYGRWESVILATRDLVTQDWRVGGV